MAKQIFLSLVSSPKSARVRAGEVHRKKVSSEKAEPDEYVRKTKATIGGEKGIHQWSRFVHNVAEGNFSLSRVELERKGDLSKTTRKTTAKVLPRVPLQDRKKKVMLHPIYMMLPCPTQSRNPAAND